MATTPSTIAEMLEWPPFKDEMDRIAKLLGTCLAGIELKGDDHSCELCEEDEE